MGLFRQTPKTDKSNRAWHSFLKRLKVDKSGLSWGRFSKGGALKAKEAFSLNRLVRIPLGNTINSVKPV